MEFIEEINKLKNEIQRDINNLFIWSSIVSETLRDKKNDKDFMKIKEYTVPSTKGESQIKRGKENLQEIFENAINKDFYYSIITYLIAIFENFLNQVAFKILKLDSKRLLITISGVNQSRKVELDKIIRSNSFDNLIEDLIKTELVNLFYASPQKYKEYFNKVLSLDIDDEIWDKWFECKATRDIIVHNNGIINDIYLSKSGDKARGMINEQIEVDEVYFKGLIVTLKSFAGKINKACKKNFIK